MAADALRPDAILTGPLLPEAVEVIAVIPMGTSVKVAGKGLTTKQVREPILPQGGIMDINNHLPTLGNPSA